MYICISIVYLYMWIQTPSMSVRVLWLDLDPTQRIYWASQVALASIILIIKRNISRLESCRDISSSSQLIPWICHENLLSLLFLNRTTFGTATAYFLTSHLARNYLASRSCLPPSRLSHLLASYSYALCSPDSWVHGSFPRKHIPSVVINWVQHISSPNHSSSIGSEIYLSLMSHPSHVLWLHLPLRYLGASH